MNTRGQAPWCYWWQYWWQSVSCMGLWRQGLCLRECAVWRGAVQTRRWNEGSPWLDFLLSCFILLFWKHRKGGFLYFTCLRTRRKYGQLSFCLKGLCFIEKYVTTPTRELWMCLFQCLYMSQNFQHSTKGKNEVTVKQWLEIVNKIAYRAYVVDGSDSDVWSLPSVPKKRKTSWDTDGQVHFHAVLFKEEKKVVSKCSSLNFQLRSALKTCFCVSLISLWSSDYLSSDTEAYQLPVEIQFKLSGLSTVLTK